MDEREIVWLGSSFRDLQDMPDKVRRTFGFALRMAQNGLSHPDTKKLKGFTPAPVEVLEDDDGDTYRAVYCAKFGDVVYVLHCFKKKSTKGVNLPTADKETIEQRLVRIRQLEAVKAKPKGTK
jgi:phage-related protein